jgi:valyl-tRNA synthetase
MKKDEEVAPVDPEYIAWKLKQCEEPMPDKPKQSPPGVADIMKLHETMAIPELAKENAALKTRVSEIEAKLAEYQTPLLAEISVIQAERDAEKEYREAVKELVDYCAADKLAAHLVARLRSMEGR